RQELACLTKRVEHDADILLGRQSPDVNEDELLGEAERFTKGRAAPTRMEELDVDAAPPDFHVGDAQVQKILTRGLGGRVGALSAPVKARQVSGDGRVQPGYAVRVRVAAEVGVVRRD